MKGAKLERANLTRANMQGAKLHEAVFSDANLREVFLGAATALDTVFNRACLADINMPQADARRASFVEADLSGADCHRTTFEAANFTRTHAQKAVFERATLQSVKAHGADLRGVNFAECNVGRCDFKACRVIDEELQYAIELEAALLTFRIANPHFCGHCGKNREVWGTKALADAHHAKMHPDLPLNSLPITTEEGCRCIVVAREAGQAAWYRGNE